MPAVDYNAELGQRLVVLQERVFFPETLFAERLDLLLPRPGA